MRQAAAALLAVLAALVPATGRAFDIADTRLVSDPAVSARQVAFAYANDLWIANLEGSGVRRLK